MTNSQTALTLKQEIEYIEGLAERFHHYDGCDGVEYGVSEKAMKVIGKLQEIIDELEDELETRRAFIVANPCAQCGGKINAMKCEAWHARAEELEEKYAKLKKSFDEISHAKQVVFKLQNELEDKQEEIEELNKKLSGEQSCLKKI
jgi:predicted RNase H-like nuclease (RuvC/YqgF family)